MKKQDVLDFFGGVTATARALRISHVAVSNWGEDVPNQSAFTAELISKGALKTDETLRMEAINGKHK